MKIFIDVETEGIEAKLILQISSLSETGEVFNVYVNPNQSLSSNCFKLSGFYFYKGNLIKNGLVLPSVTIVSALKSLNNWISKQAIKSEVHLIAHNAFGFDIPVLIRHYRKFQIKLPNVTLVSDTLPALRKTFGKKFSTYKLENIAKEFKIKFDNPHDSLEDVICLKKIFDAIASEPSVSFEDCLKMYTKPFTYFIKKTNISYACP